jgi:Ca2+-binding EF-hand superfamily protein
VFRFENAVFTKIAKVLLRAKISPAEAFATFDVSKDGRLSRKEFSQALEMMKVHDLTVQEVDVVWDSLDVDKSGFIDYKEFARKLEHYGVRSRSKEEIIITSMVEAVNRSSVKSLPALFDIIDTTGRGYIDR